MHNQCWSLPLPTFQNKNALLQRRLFPPRRRICRSGHPDRVCARPAFPMGSSQGECSCWWHLDVNGQRLALLARHAFSHRDPSLAVLHCTCSTGTYPLCGLGIARGSSRCRLSRCSPSCCFSDYDQAGINAGGQVYHACLPRQFKSTVTNAPSNSGLAVMFLSPSLTRLSLLGLCGSPNLQASMPPLF